MKNIAYIPCYTFICNVLELEILFLEQPFEIYFIRSFCTRKMSQNFLTEQQKVQSVTFPTGLGGGLPSRKPRQEQPRNQL